MRAIWNEIRDYEALDWACYALVVFIIVMSGLQIWEWLG